jgi:stress-induced morphogen
MTLKTPLPDRQIREIDKTLKSEFPSLSESVDDVVRRYHSASIRMRLIDQVFQGKSLADREQIALRALAKLPEAVADSITMLLTLTPDEAARQDSIMNAEFCHPNKSNL